MSTGTRATLEALPSPLGMSPTEARAAQVLGADLDAGDRVTLAGAWLGTGLYTPALCDLAASDWDDAGVAALWERALDELGVTTPSVDRARHLVRTYLDRRLRRAPAPRCTCHRATADVDIPRPRSPEPVVPA